MATRSPKAGSADDGHRDYYATNGVQCTQAIRACLGREGYIAWLRGTKMRYMWRLGAKPNEDPKEAAIKDNWYGRELERVLADPEA